MKLDKKLAVLVGLLVFGLGCQKAHADVAATNAGAGPAPVAAASAGSSSIYYHIGALNLTVPWDNVNVVYMYDLNGKRNLVGGEAGIASLWILQATLGAVTSLDGEGAPYVGGNVWLPNPIPQLAILNYVKPGVFGGYDWNRGASIFGLKASIPLFQ